MPEEREQTPEELHRTIDELWEENMKLRAGLHMADSYLAAGRAEEAHEIIKATRAEAQKRA